MAGPDQFFLPEAVQKTLLEQVKKQILYSAPAAGQNGTYDGFNHRIALENIDREYYRDNIYTKDKIEAANANRRGDKKKLQDVVLPVMETQTETMLAFLASVFLTGNPIFGVTASPEHIEQAKAYQAILSDQATYGSWVGEFLDFFLNSLKYFGVMEAVWCRETTYSAQVTVRDGGKLEDRVETLWAGNRLLNIDPYNFFWDRRVPLTLVAQRAEYAGYTEMLSRVMLKQYVESKNLKMNVDKVFDPNYLGTPPVKMYYVPDFMWNSLDNLERIQSFGQSNSRFVDDFSTFEIGPEGRKRTFRNAYYKVTRYVRLIPKDYGFPASVPMPNKVQIWKIVTINDQVIIECERQSNNHNLLPLVCSQPVIDGLLYNNRSFAQKAQPMQDITSALMNNVFDAARRSISDRMLYDPSKVTANNISSTSPTARIPCRPSAYGTKMADAVHVMPFENHQTITLQAVIKDMMNYTNNLLGQNQAQQGQFVKGNKTQAEYEDVQGHSSGRQRKLALKIEQQAMQPLKFIIKANILQYQGSAQIYNYDDNSTVEIDPQKLRQAIFTYTVVDGVTPEDKITNPAVLQAAFQTIATVPLLQSGYNLPNLFSYMMQTQNIPIKQFQLAPQQAGQQLTDMSNAGLTPGVATAKIGIGGPAQ